ncbi:DMT family transporter [Ligilactobacillus saerimneri]
MREGSVGVAKQSKHAFWVGVAILACSMWGISGLLAKALFNQQISAIWLTQVRMVVAGAILLVIGHFKGEQMTVIWRDRKAAGRLVLYSILGLIPVQFCYFMAVKEGNAAIATVLQFTCLFFVMVYDTVIRRVPLRLLDIICALIAFTGVATIATEGHFTHMTITVSVLLWGLASALGAAVNMTTPGPLTRHYSSWQVTGWGLLVAGIVMVIAHPVWEPVHLTPVTILLVVGVIIIGTLLPFQMLNLALRHITATTANMMDAFEPLAATIGSVLFLGLSMTSADYIGTFLVIGAVLGLNYRPAVKKQVRKME